MFTVWQNGSSQRRFQQYDQKWRDFLKAHAERIGHPNPEQFSLDGWRKRAGGRGMNHALASLEKEICQRQDRTFVYKLARAWSNSLVEYIKPFGEFRTLYDDGLVLEGEIIDPKKYELIGSLTIMRPENILQITFAPRKNLRFLVQRFERQLKKFQSCILCGSCASTCPENAISANGRYIIDRTRCTGCLSCVKALCVVVGSLTQKGSQLNWSVCNGSV